MKPTTYLAGWSWRGTKTVPGDQDDNSVQGTSGVSLVMRA